MNNKTNKSFKQLICIYIHTSCKCDTNRAGHFTLDAYASRPVACPPIAANFITMEGLWGVIQVCSKPPPPPPPPPPSFKHSNQIPHSAFARGPRSPAFEERMRAAMGATGERSPGRPPYPEWHVYWFLFLPEISSFVITCTYLFTADDNHLQKSTILSSVICVIQVISSHYIILDYKAAIIYLCS